MIFGERIKTKRLDKNYSQQELGKLIGVSKVSVCGYESGKRTPTLTVLLELIKALDTTFDYLIGNDVVGINEDEEKYSVFISNEDMEIIKELKKNNVLYKRLLADPKRTIELINRKLNN